MDKDTDGNTDAMEPLTIEVVSDVVCPWCYIGKRRLETALELYARACPGAPAPSGKASSTPTGRPTTQ